MPEEANASVVLAAHDLWKRYGTIEAVRGVSLEIHEGETYGLLGPNGAGKTTTISMICGLLARDGGEVTLDGTPVDVGAVAAKSAIGFVPQELAIYPDLNARENLEFFGRLYGLSGAHLKTRIGEVLEIVGLTARAGDRTDKFSGGMQRRLNIGIGLLHQPRLLLLDEPTVGVDPQSRNAILESIAALGKQGMAILYTTHYMEEAERLCDRVGIIDAGEIRAEGTQRELVALIGEQDTVRLTVTGDVAAAAADVAAVPGVVRADAKDTTIEILVSDARQALPRLIAAAEVKADVKGVDVVEPDLEAVFLHLTGRALRDTAE
ncbi:MAG: ABC transporter ATP-binding protein [Chloroflexi bacterium]|nr:ABC transporter ATP-binding protein [Chloroflexota bacterium]